MDQFVESLPNARKELRQALIIDELITREHQVDRTQVLILLEEIARLGKNWEKLLFKAASQYLKEYPASNISKPIRDFLAATKRVQFAIEGKETGAILRDMSSFLQRLENLPSQLRPNLTINFKTNDAYVYGLCAIAAWASAHADSISFQSTYPRVEYFLQRAGVIDGLQNPNSDPVKFDTETILGFTRIDPHRSFDTDGHAGRLVELFRRHMELDHSMATALSISFAELIENSIKHGGINTPAWLFANYHPQARIMHVCICDRGMGVQRTFMQSTNERLRHLALNDNQWLKEATEPLVTSKSEGHAGYGLFLARELCRRNAGLFAIISGKVAYGIRPQSPDASVASLNLGNLLCGFASKTSTLEDRRHADCPCHYVDR